MDLAMHGIHEMTDNPEANTEAALLTPAHHAFEGVEDAGLVFFRGADSAAVTNEGDLDRLARAIFDGVRQEVIGDMLYRQFIKQPGHLACDARF